MKVDVYSDRVTPQETHSPSCNDVAKSSMGLKSIFNLQWESFCFKAFKNFWAPLNIWLKLFQESSIFNLQWESLHLKAFQSFFAAFGPIEDLAKLQGPSRYGLRLFFVVVVAFLFFGFLFFLYSVCFGVVFGVFVGQGFLFFGILE